MRKGLIGMWWVVPLLVAFAGCAAKQAVSEKPSVLGEEGRPGIARPAPPAVAPMERRPEALAPTERRPEAVLPVRPGEVARPPREAVPAGREEARPGVREEIIRPRPGEGVIAPVRPEEVARPPRPGEVAALPGVAEAAASPFKDIHFDFDKYNLRPDAKSILGDIGKWLRANRQPKVTIEGHADERGSDEYNLALGERRAESARAYLKTQGVEVERLATISYGEFRPIDPGKTEEAYAKNRRDHFLLKY